jgi:hypothetical protein
MAHREDDHMPVVQAHIAAQLGRPVVRIGQRSDEGPTPDLRTDDGRRPSIAIEVKELIPTEFVAVTAQVARAPGLDSQLLTKRWSVLVTEEPLSSRLAPMPTFRADPPAHEVRRLAEQGLTLISKAELEEQWRQEHTLQPRARVNVKRLAKDIEADLAVLERYGIFETRGYELPRTGAADHRTAFNALRAVRQRTRDAICMAHDPIGIEQPGIDIEFGYGTVRSGNPDVVAERVQMWLDDDLSDNLVASLTESGADETHAALWLSTEPEAESARAQGAGFCPALPMRLPDGVDVLWVFIEPVALRYDSAWSAGLVHRTSAEQAAP